MDKVTQFWNTNLKELGCITKVDKHKIMLDDRVPSSEYLEEKMFVHNPVSTERTITKLTRRIISCLKRLSRTIW